jgi:hypothetical protein
MNKRASTAILMPQIVQTVVQVGDDDEDATASTETAIKTPQAAANVARAQSIADRLRKLLQETSGMDERDPNGVVTGMIYQTVAMSSYRVREFEIDFDYTAQLKTKNLSKNIANCRTVRGSDDCQESDLEQRGSQGGHVRGCGCTQEEQRRKAIGSREKPSLDID